MSLIIERPTATTDDGFQWLSQAEERAFFDEKVREMLHISGEQFLQRLDAGYYDHMVDDIDHADLMYLTLLSRVAR